MNDTDLISLLQMNDQTALEAAVNRFGGYVTAVIRNQLGAFAAPEDTEELVSDVFVSLWKNRHKLQTDHLRGWLAVTARNLAVDFLRKNKLLTVQTDDVLLIADDRVQELMEVQERRRIVQEAVGQLSMQDREIFLRYYYYSQSIPDIAAAVSMNQNTVKSRLMRGRQKLKDILVQGGYIHES